MSSPPILIFSGRLLPSSETFIKAQADGLRDFVPYFAGARVVDGLPLPEKRTVVVNSGGYLGKIREFLFKQTGYAPGFYQKLHRLDPSLIHAHFGVCGTLALPIARELKIPLIVTFHGFDASMTDEYARRNSLSTRVYLQRREQLKQEAHLFIAVSHFIKSRLVQQGFPEDRIKVHYIGIDTERFKTDPSVVRQRKVLFVGRLVEKKGCRYLIEAMAKVQAAAPDVELVIIGDGPLRLELEALADKSLKHYKFLGLQTPDQVKQWMNQAQVLVAPSITTKDGDTEGLPIVILEAQAMGLPVIGTVHAGIPEAIIDGDTGFLVQEGDRGKIAQRIELLCSSPNCWSELSYKGRQFVCSNFDLQKQTQKLEAIYKKTSSC
jgi:glycosyltransferase involved in cell wall biosynthesis